MNAIQAQRKGGKGIWAKGGVVGRGAPTSRVHPEALHILYLTPLLSPCNILWRQYDPVHNGQLLSFLTPPMPIFPLHRLVPFLVTVVAALGCMPLQVAISMFLGAAVTPIAVPVPTPIAIPVSTPLGAAVAAIMTAALRRCALVVTLTAIIMTHV